MHNVKREPILFESHLRVFNYLVKPSPANEEVLLTKWTDINGRGTAIFGHFVYIIYNLVYLLFILNYDMPFPMQQKFRQLPEPRIIML